MAIPCTESIELTKESSAEALLQKTLSKSVSISGNGLFTAAKSVLTIYPGEPNTGIVFRRSDLPDAPCLSAKIQNVVSTPRCTILGNRRFTIHTVEHVLAALNALGIDNALLDLSGPEVPIMDGSAFPFVELINKAGVVEQDQERMVYRLQTPFSWSKGEVYLIAIPSETYRISYTLHFPNSSILRSQFVSVPIDSQCFTKEIASSRTFCFYEEIAPFVENGLIKGGSLKNAVIIRDDKVINPDGIRFPDEMVRHKVLDLIGDLSLIPHFIADIIAIRSGHASNVAFAQEFYNHLKMENC